MNEFIDWDILDFKGKTTGRIYIKCPDCSEHRKSANKNKPCLSVDISKGVGHCHNCGKSTFRKEERPEKEQPFELPKQDWKNYTQLSDNLVKWLEERKINQFTAIALGWTMEKKWHHVKKKEVSMLCFNSFELDRVVNKKYRTGKGKYFTQDANGKPIFYNINSAIGQTEIYIVEGQMDVAAMYEIGIKNVISLPNGAQDSDDVWSNSKKYLEGVEKFYIATDNDEPGQSVAEKIAHRLGKWRCEKITFKGKDANDDLISGVLKESVSNPEPFKVLGTYDSEDLYPDMLELYKSGLPPTIKPKNRDFELVNDIFSTMRGHLTVVSGIPSHGKSTFTEWYVMNLVHDHGMKAAFFSPEHIPMALHMTSFVEKAFGKNYFREFPKTPRISEEEILRYSIWAKEKIYLTSPDAGTYADWEWLMGKFNEIKFTKGADIFVIDAFNKVEFKDGGDERQNIKKVLSRLTDFAGRNDCIVILVAHPTKMQKNDDGTYKAPTLYDVSGSADFRNMTHDGYCIHRIFDIEGEKGYTTFTNLKTKMNFQGKIGHSVEMDYHLPSGRYYPRGGNEPTYCLFEGGREIKEMDPYSEYIVDNEIDNGVPF